MYETIIVWLALTLILVILSIAWIINGYNRLVIAKQELNQAYSNMKTEHQRRFDLFINLANDINSYKKHENDTQVNLTLARSKLSGDKSKQIETMQSNDNFFNRLFAVYENYPGLKSNEQHNIVLGQILSTENRLNESRRGYNELAKKYNLLVYTFPDNILAFLFKFRGEPYYESKKEEAIIKI